LTSPSARPYHFSLSAMIGQTLSHYRIIEKHEGQSFIVMEYLEGLTLKHRIGNP
jgi:hypothetical protein